MWILCDEIYERYHSRSRMSYNKGMCVDLFVLIISMFILFSNVIDETITLLFNSFMGKNHTTKMC